MFESLFRALFKEHRNSAEAWQLSFHLDKMLLNEKSGIDILYPDVKEKAEKLRELMSKKGKPIYVSSTFRSVKMQNVFYDKGRKSPGSTITNAKGLESYHNYGLAFDVAFISHNWSPPAGWWEELGAEGKKLGLIWGGDFDDVPHFEWHPGFTWEKLLPYFVL